MLTPTPKCLPPGELEAIIAATAEEDARIIAASVPHQHETMARLDAREAPSAPDDVDRPTNTRTPTSL